MARPSVSTGSRARNAADLHAISYRLSQIESTAASHRIDGHCPANEKRKRRPSECESVHEKSEGCQTKLKCEDRIQLTKGERFFFKNGIYLRIQIADKVCGY